MEERILIDKILNELKECLSDIKSSNKTNSIIDNLINTMETSSYHQLVYHNLAEYHKSNNRVPTSNT